MNWCEIAIFLYLAALTHFISEFLSSHLKKRGKGFFVLHCFFYTLLFLPLFWWLEINLLWLILVFGSHFLIDLKWLPIEPIVRALYKKEKEIHAQVTIYGLDQVLHLLILLIIALFA